MSICIMTGDCVDRLQELDPDSLDSCVSDPPYHLTSIVKRFSKSNLEQPSDKDLSKVNAGQYRRLAAGFMGQQWDGGDVAFRAETWRAVYRVLKPGAYLAAFAAPRNSHQLATAIEAAGFEIRDEIATLICSDYIVQSFLASLDPEQQQAFARCVHDSPFGGVLEWVFGQGFPKSDDAERVVAKMTCPLEGRHYARELPDDRKPGDHVCPVTPQSEPWLGYGTALKPAREPIVIARKPPLGSVAANLLQHGTGALNIDAGRIEGVKPQVVQGVTSNPTSYQPARKRQLSGDPNEGRHPANLILVDAPEVMAGFPQTSTGKLRAEVQRTAFGQNGIFNTADGRGIGKDYSAGSGSSARYFYTAKPAAAERHEGCRDLPNRKNPHPTVKPIDLMCYVVGIVTPAGGTVLDPFLGSGTTAIAAAKLQMDCVGIELSPVYVALAERRIHHHVGLFADLTIDPAPLPARGAEEPDAGTTHGDQDGESSNVGAR